MSFEQFALVYNLVTLGYLFSLAVHYHDKAVSNPQYTKHNNAVTGGILLLIEAICALIFKIATPRMQDFVLAAILLPGAAVAILLTCVIVIVRIRRR